MRIGEGDHKLMSQLHYLEKWFEYRNMRIGEGDHKLMSQLHYLEKWFEYRNMYTVSQSMHSSEQNLPDTCNAFYLSFQDFV